MTRFSLRAWLFVIFASMVVINGGWGWWVFSKLPSNPGWLAGLLPGGGAPENWLLPIFLAGTLPICAAFALLLAGVLSRAQHAYIHATYTLAQVDLPRLTAALGALSEGDLTMQIESQARELPTALYPGSENQVSAYNTLVREIHQTYQKFNDVNDEPCRRMVYVGADAFLQGRTCGDIMGQLLEGQGKVVIVTGLQGQSLEIRKTGFLAMLHEKYPGIQVVALLEGHGHSENVESQLEDIFRRTPDLSGIYVVDGNTPAVTVRALQAAGKAGTIKLVCHDLVDETMRALQQGVVSATISQDPYAQGHDPVIYLYNYLVAGQLPPRPKMTTPSDRITRQNYQDYWDPERGAIESEAVEARRARPVEQIPARPLRILVLGREDITFFDPLKQGALQAAEELKSRNTMVEWIEPEAARQDVRYGVAVYGPAIEAAIAGKYDAIAVPVYDKALVPYINRAVEAGIPVATFNSEPSSLRSLMNHLMAQSQQLRDISLELAQAAAVSEDRASQINRSVGEMNQALHQEAQSALQAIENTRQMAQAIANIQQGAQEQTQAAGRVSGAIGQISQAVDSANQTALVSEQTAEQAVCVAREGAETIQQTLHQIAEISDAVKASVAQIHDLNKLSRQIDVIVNTVNDIAEQTNMLALNATIEAARAGEHGRGFAVVAAEVRSLATLSKKSTKEIAALIRQVQQNSGKMVASVDVAMNQAQSGSQLAAQAGQALGELTKSAEMMRAQTENVVQANRTVIENLDHLTDANQQVVAVIEENASATEQVNENIGQTVEMVNHMSDISKENSVSIDAIHTRTDEVAEGAQRLKVSIATLAHMAEEMQGAVAAFKISPIDK